MPANQKAGLAKAIRALSKFHIGLGSASGIATALILFVIIPDVVGRALFSYTIPAAAEIGVLLLLCKIFLGLPGAQASNAFFNADAVVNLLSPRWRRWVQVATTLVAFVVVTIIASITAQEALQSTLAGEVSYGVHSVPIWPGRIVVALGLSLLALQLLADTARLILGIERVGHEGSGLSPE
jgi:TRAP-type C4-dicarboxylate transport system permease small subunit